MSDLMGTPGDDTLPDTAGNDTIRGLAGNDTISVSAGADSVNGGEGIDRLVVNYAGQTDAVQSRGDTGIGVGASGGTTSVTYRTVESFDITTGSGADTIRSFYREDPGNSSADGSDTNNLTIVSGNDIILSGAGDDLIGAGEGNDTILGGAGDDRLDGDGQLNGKFGGGNLGSVTFGGNDFVSGEDGNDSIYGGNGADILDGGIGNDLLVGDRSAFIVRDTSGGSAGSVAFQENVGSDASSGSDTLSGGDGNDTLAGNAFDDSLTGGAGDDLVQVTITSDGADQVNLGAGNDVVQVTANGSSQVSSAVRLTFTSAEIGNANALDAGTLANQDGGLAVRMQSEDNAGNLTGGVSRYDDEGITFVAQGNTTFDVRDLVSGVARGDLFKVVVLGTEGADTLSAVQTTLPYYFNAGMGNDLVTDGTANDFLVGGGGADTLIASGGNDSFIGGGGDDSMIGGEGADRAIANLSTDGADSVNLGAGMDIVDITAPGQVRVTFTSAQVGNASALDTNNMANQDGGLAVRLQAEAAGDVLTGPVSRYDDEGITFIAQGASTFDVRDLVSGVARGDQFKVVTLGTEGAETLTAVQSTLAYYFNAGMGDDRITDGTANDFLVGGAGNDTLLASAGDDSFIGGAGNDSLLGGEGADRAIANLATDGADSVNLGAGMDLVDITAPGQIRISFTSAQVGNASALDSNTMANQDGGLAVRVQAEDGADGLTGAISRYDDEGITFIAQGASTFDVRDLVSGVQRGDFFKVVVLGTEGADTLTAVQSTLAYYFNAGMGDDLVTDGSANDFLVGGAGNDTLLASAGNDSFIGGAGDDSVIGGEGADRAIANLATDGADRVNLGAGMDVVDITAPGQIRISFTSAQVGNASALDSNTMANQDGGLAVRLQAEAAGDVLTGPVSRYDDEGITFIAQGASTFDVRDLVSGVQRGDQFKVVVLGTEGGDTLTALQNTLAYYFNAGMGNDFVTDGTANDFLVGGGGNDTLLASAGNDSFLGGDGNDQLTGGSGNDLIDGGAGFDVAFFTSTLGNVLATDLGQRVLISGAEGADTLSGIERLVFADGSVTLDDGDRLFDSLFYLKQNPDVYAAGIDPLVHYAQFGFREGRDPNAFFDSSGYLAVNPDVAAAGLNPLEHYRTLGGAEQRDTSIDFDTRLYLQNNPDVVAAGVNALDHFLTFGRVEGRVSYTAIGQIAPDGFDRAFYLFSNPDVAAAGVDPRTHFATLGAREGRDASVLFDSSFYFANNPDVAAAGVDPLAHFNQFGFREGRDPSLAFDTSAYLAANADVAAAGVNPLTHYLQNGVYEGRAIADSSALIA